MSDEKVVKKVVKKAAPVVEKNTSDKVILQIERIEYEPSNGIDPPTKKSKPYEFITDARAFETNFLKYHRTQGLTIVKVTSMPDRIKFDHAEYLEGLKPKKTKSR